jgi:hypothetical protein
MTPKRLAAFSALALVLLLFSAPSEANRVVTSYTLVPVTAADVTNINLTRQTDGLGGTVIIATSTFEVKDTLGAVRYTATISQQLTPAQRTSLGTFVTNTTVPLLNSQENL